MISMCGDYTKEILMVDLLAMLIQYLIDLI